MKLPIKFIHKNQHFLLLVLLLILAFWRNVESVKGLSFGYDFDSERDLSNVQNIINGNYYNDLSYVGEYMWYNPLITYTEAVIVKLTGLSPLHLVTKAGAYLNILGVIFFYILLNVIFNSGVAIAASASFLFFSTGNMPSWGAATYSPWLYPVNFMQGIFYIGIIVYYLAFLNPGNLNFILAGLITGIAFLGHSAPAVILLLIFAFLYLRKIRILFKTKTGVVVFRYLKYGLLFNISFVIVSLPFLVFVAGKYKLKMINQVTYEFTDPLFAIGNIPGLIMNNVSISLVVSLVGLYFLYFSYRKNIAREILFAWLFICIFLFLYTSFVPFAHYHLNMTLPGIVPSFHFFFYLKALQSVLFGIGFFHLCGILYRKISSLQNKRDNGYHFEFANVLTILVLVLSSVYYPVYSQREDFFTPREYSLNKAKEVDEIEMYHWLLQKTSINEVVVCDENISSFPVMATGRKLVAVIPSMSNPYVNYDSRNEDRNFILNNLMNGNVTKTRVMLNKYMVSYIILERNKIIVKTSLDFSFGAPVFENKKYCIYKYQTISTL